MVASSGSGGHVDNRSDDYIFRDSYLSVCLYSVLMQPAVFCLRIIQALCVRKKKY